MQRRNNTLQLSPTDLSNFLGCKHRTALDMAVAAGLRAKPALFEDPLRELLFERGLEHEADYVEWLKAQNLSVVDLSRLKSPDKQDELVAATSEAMKAGIDVIVQGGLFDEHWFGKPDILRRVESPSALGAWSYEVYDTKLSRNTKAGAILQLSLYSAMVARVQGVTPEKLFIVAPRYRSGSPVPEEITRDKPCPDEMMVLEFRVNDYAAYFRLMRRRMEETVVRDPTAVAEENYPDPVSQCTICRWDAVCEAKRRNDDHSSLVAGISRSQRRELATMGITTRAKIATTWPLPAAPSRGSLETYENAHKQARVQVQSDGQAKPVFEIRPIVAARPATGTEQAQQDEGLCRLPEPSPGDMFLDLEGDPYAVEGGREYLIGVATEDDGRENFHSFWGFNDHDERQSFERVMDMIAERRAKHPGMHVYHYAPYEVTAFRKLRLRYETRSTELDAMLRAGVFVDLYAVVRQGVRIGTESYSIKQVERLYEFERKVELKEASVCRNAVEIALQSGEMPADDIIETVRGYNEDDCVSTLRLRSWLEKIRAEYGEPIPRPTLIAEEPRELNKREERANELREKLLAGLPADRSERSPEQQARWMLAYLMDYHRREALASFWEYYRLRGLSEDELEDEPQAVTDLEFVERVHTNVTKKGKPTGVVTDRYRYPHQEMEIEKVDLKLREGGTFGSVVAVDRGARTIDVKKQKIHIDYHPVSVFAHRRIQTDAQEDALYGVASRVVEDGGVIVDAGSRDLAARRLVMSLAPVLSSGSLAPATGDAVPHLIDSALALDHSVLPVQGPPGAGKTYAGAEAIYALVKAGKKIGVAANSHTVIRKLLDEVADAAKRHNDTVALGHKCDADAFADTGAGIAELRTNEAVREALDDATLRVVGGTSWLWARVDLADAVDVLFVDEAGQVALANVVAMSPCAASIVLLGDPQQLEQPRKATHPDGIDVSALEHVLAGHATVPDDRGVFLPRTWRMCPAITEYTSEMFYESRLASIAGLENQRLNDAGGLSGAGLRVVFAEHDGNRSYANEEVALIKDLVASLASGVATWTNSNGASAVLKGGDVLVVAPYNAQVSRLATALHGSGARAGTVDKFQGQEAPVVVYSMATSRPEDAPRGMEFLYSLNRLNVASSRARCIAVIVANARLFEPECRTPRQMRLANALCRYAELAASSALA